MTQKVTVYRFKDGNTETEKIDHLLDSIFDKWVNPVKIKFFDWTYVVLTELFHLVGLRIIQLVIEPVIQTIKNAFTQTA